MRSIFSMSVIMADADATGVGTTALTAPCHNVRPEFVNPPMRLRLFFSLISLLSLTACSEPARVAPAEQPSDHSTTSKPADSTPPETTAQKATHSTPEGHDAQAAARVAASMDRFAKAHSFHAEMTLEGQQHIQQSLDFVAPDRYRILLPAGPQVIVGNTLYLQAAGRMTRVPVENATLTQWRDPLQLQAAREHLWVQPQGPEDVDGLQAHKYRVVSGEAEQPVAFEYWIGPDERPLQLRHQGQGKSGPYTMTLRYSRFNDPAIQVHLPE